MADPVVGITNGVPTSGTGTITTLGLTIPPATSTTSGVQGGPMVQGAVTTSAPTYTTGQIDPLSLTTAGALRVDSSAVTQPVSGTFWQATQPVSGTVTANQGGSNWTVNVAQINGVTPLMGNGVTGTGSQRVTIASDNTAFSVNAIQSGTWNIGTLTSITNTVNVASATAPASTMNSASATGGIASAMAAVFDDVTPTAITENNFGYVRMSANRNQYATIRDAAGNERGVNVTSANALVVDASATTQPVSGTVTVTQATAANLNATVTGTVAATQSGNWTNRIVGNAGATLDVASSQNVAMPTNMLVVGGEFNTSPTAITSGNASPLQLNGSGSLRVDGSGVTQPVSGTFWQATQPVSGTVTANQGGAPWSENQTQLNGVALGSPSNYGTSPGAVSVQGVNAFVTNTVTVSGTVTANQGTPPWLVGGDVASGSADSGNPVKIGGIAAGLTANPTPVTVGQRVNAYVDKVGRQIVAGSPRALKVSTYTTLTTTTETTIIGATVSAFNDLYSLIITNSSATATFVDIRNTTGGAVVMTIAAPAGDTRGFTVPVDSAMNQSTANTNWTAQLRTAVTSINITAMAATTV
jgi:hypothetical protein